MSGNKSIITLLSFPENFLDKYENTFSIISSPRNGKKYLNHKRKRSGVDKLDNTQNKLTKEDNINNSNNNSFKFQDFPKSLLSIIFTYLSFDDLLKLKSLGCRNTYNYLNEIIEIKKSEGCYNFNPINSMKLPNFNFDNDSVSSKKYFYSNVINKNNVPKELKIKYIIYHESSNKNYYLIKTPLFYYFCSCDTDKIITKDNWADDILFKIREIDYFEKFQFINNSKVVIFSIKKILLYDLSNEEYKYNIISLSFSCDFVLFKMNLNLLIVPDLSCQFISFYSINKYLPKRVKKEKNKMEITHVDKKLCNNGHVIDLYDNLICIFCSCSKYVIIFDCKKKKAIKNIKFNYNIKNIEFNNKYLIVYTSDNSINFFDNLNFLPIFNLNLEKIGIKYISMIEPSLFDNIFLAIRTNKKICVIYMENNSFFSFVTLDNELNINENQKIQFIGNKLIKGKNEDNEDIYRLKVKIISSKDCDSINEYFINDYLIGL